MKRPIGKLFMITCYLFYAGLIYTFMVPENPYLGYIENLRYLYLLVHIPFYVLMSIFALALVIGEKSIRAKLTDEFKTFKGEKKEKAKKEIENLLNPKLKTKLLLLINRIITISTMLVVFVGLGDHFLGGLMLYGTFLTYVFVSNIKSVIEGARKVVSE